MQEGKVGEREGGGEALIPVAVPLDRARLIWLLPGPCVLIWLLSPTKKMRPHLERWKMGKWENGAHLVPIFHWSENMSLAPYPIAPTRFLPLGSEISHALVRRRGLPTLSLANHGCRRPDRAFAVTQRVFLRTCSRRRECCQPPQPCVRVGE
jgi:hypothetical protein